MATVRLQCELVSALKRPGAAGAAADEPGPGVGRGAIASRGRAAASRAQMESGRRAGGHVSGRKAAADGVYHGNRPHEVRRGRSARTPPPPLRDDVSAIAGLEPDSRPTIEAWCPAEVGDDAAGGVESAPCIRWSVRPPRRLGTWHAERVHPGRSGFGLEKRRTTVHRKSESTHWFGWAMIVCQRADSPRLARTPIERQFIDVAEAVKHGVASRPGDQCRSGPWEGTNAEIREPLAKLLGLAAWRSPQFSW